MLPALKGQNEFLKYTPYLTFQSVDLRYCFTSSTLQQIMSFTLDGLRSPILLHT